ncbi:MAG TPA: hypothetical protein VFL80_11070 [Thermoanaerobaculia bacterium]|nr:hypothetical protein [Thermoanaerobaculia bacterium]
MTTLNIAGPEYDFANVVFVVLQECEHRRRALGSAGELMSVAREKLAQIRKAYDEFGGSRAYWATLEREVLETAMPQYVDAALEMNRLERAAWGVFRRGDLAARGLFGLGGLLLGGFIKALPFIPTIENLFVFALAGAGLIYPDLVRYIHERRHARLLNRLVADAAQYQRNARLHYMTTDQIRESFAPPSEDSSPVVLSESKDLERPE